MNTARRPAIAPPREDGVPGTRARERAAFAVSVTGLTFANVCSQLGPDQVSYSSAQTAKSAWISGRTRRAVRLDHQQQPHEADYRRDPQTRADGSTPEMLVAETEQGSRPGDSGPMVPLRAEVAYGPT
jgi:hypothetical protein